MTRLKLNWLLPRICVGALPLALATLGLLGCDGSQGAGPIVTAVEPARGPLRGGNRVTLLGEGLTQDAVVRFGGVEAVVSSAGATALEVVAPPASAAGWVDISVRVGSGTTVLPGAYRYDGIPLRFIDVSAVDLYGDAPLRGRLAAVVDLDGDGDLDVVQGAQDGLRLYANRGDGRFDTWPAHRIDGIGADFGDWVNQPVVGDFDGDGRPDLFLVTYGYAPDRLLLNRGPASAPGLFPGARFVDATHIPEGSTQSLHAVAADLDGDGDLDLVIVRLAYQNAELEVDDPAHVAVWINDGAGHFTEEGVERLPDAFLAARGVAAGDVDGDGDVDLFLATNSGACRLWLNDGRGVFREAPPDALPPHGDLRGRMPSMGDLTGDGNLDILVVSTQQNRLWINDGKGRFSDQTAERLGLDDGVGYSAVIADLDLDGVNDLAVASSDGRFRIYRTDEVGRLFEYSGQVRPALPADGDALGVVVGDFDGDGDPDIFVSRYNLRRPWLLRSWDPLPMTDSDGDGIPDVVDNCPFVPNPDQANADTYHFSCRDREACTALTGCTLEIWRGESAYLVCRTSPMTWDEAQSHCSAFGGDLVVIGSAEEDAFLASVVGETVWIGLNDRLEEGNFQWVDGSPLDYTNWREGEPNDSGGNEDCAGVWVVEGEAPGWNDFPCDRVYAFVCQDAVRRGAPDPGSACDNCPLVHNPDQMDTNGNGVGDACDEEGGEE